MKDRGKDFDAVLFAFTEQIFIVTDAFRIGLLFVTVREQACPADRSAEDLHTHLGEQGDVLFIGMVEVDAAPVGIISGVHILQSLIELCLGKGAAVVLRFHLFMIPCRIEIAQILGGDPLPAIAEASVCLRTGNGAAPQEIGIEARLCLQNHKMHSFCDGL